MCRTILPRLFGFVSLATVAAPVLAQDAPFAFLGTSEASLFPVTISAKNAIEASDATLTADVKALVAFKQPITKVEFKIEKRELSKYDEPEAFAEPEFWCGLIYDGDMVNIKVGDGEPVSDKAFTPEEDAAQKVADAFEFFFPEDMKQSVVVTRVKNSVVLEFVSPEVADMMCGVTFGGPSLKYKVSVGIFTETSFDSDIGKYKIAIPDGQTGGPLMPPPEWYKSAFEETSVETFGSATSK